jgi:pimeloyl-ACP methyl ester carboxylesterase
MLRTTILITLTAFVISSCNKSQNTSVDVTVPQKKEMKRDSMSGYASINGLKMYYEIHGKGTPLVLIHGGGSTIETTFGRVLHSFARERQVIAVELQGHGHTAQLDRPQTFENDADDVAALLNHLKIEHADIFGFSNGGNTTMQIAIRHPELVRKIVLGSSFYKRDGMYPQFWEMMKGATLSNMPSLLKEAYRKVAPDTSDLIKMFNNDKNRMVGFKDWKAEDLRSIRAPALIIDGDQDVVRPEHAVEMFRLIPNSQLAIIPGGHGKYIGEITTLSNQNTDTLFVVPMIKEFLDADDGVK